jgi:PAS domain S-box-containing protein
MPDASADPLALLEAFPDAAIIVDPDGRILRLNAPARALAPGINAGADFDTAFPLLCAEPPGERLTRADWPSLTELRHHGGDLPVRLARDGSAELDLRLRVSSLAPAGLGVEGSLVTLHVFAHVIGICPAQDALSESIEQFRVAGGLFPYGVWTADPQGTFLYVSPALLDLLSMTFEEFQRGDWFIRMNESDAAAIPARWLECLEIGADWSSEVHVRGDDGQPHKVLFTGRPIRDSRGRITSWAGVTFDVTARDLLEERTRSLREKEVLLTEVHHRIKNNLQIVISLLRMQGRKLRNELARNALRESEHRIQSMAMIHEFLYQSSNYSSLDLVAYLRRISEHLVTSYGLPGVRCRVLGDRTQLNLDQAVPCGLIANELVSNALKHAFPSGSGNLRVAVEQNGDLLRLTVADDGVGLPAGFDIASSARGVGMQVVDALARRQLHGAISVDSTTGTSFQVEFELDG